MSEASVNLVVTTPDGGLPPLYVWAWIHVTSIDGTPVYDAPRRPE